MQPLTRAVIAKSSDGGGAAFSVAIAFAFAFTTTMVVSCFRLVVVSMPPPLDSLPAAISACQCPDAFPLAPLLTFASVCWLIVALPLVAPPTPCITFCCAAASPVHPPPPPLCSCQLVVASHLVALPPPLNVPPAHMLPLAAPPPHIRQLAPFLLPPLLTLWPLPASSNARRTLLLLAASSPTTTVSSCLALVLQRGVPSPSIMTGLAIGVRGAI